MRGFFLRQFISNKKSSVILLWMYFIGLQWQIVEALEQTTYMRTCLDYKIHCRVHLLMTNDR